MTRSQINIISLAFSVFALSTMAFAQEKLEVTATVATHAYPTAVSQRPFTLPSGMVELGGKMKLGTSRDTLALDFAHLNVGITNDTQIGLSWFGFQIPKFDLSQSLNVSVGHFLFANDWAASMAYLEVPIHFNKNAIRNISFAMPTAIPVVKNVSVIAFYDSLVDFGFNKGNYSASFNLPVALSYQVTPNIALEVSSRLAKFEVATGNNNTYFWNSMPARVKGLYAVNNGFDVVASAGFDDAFNAKESFSVMMGAQFRVGNLDG